MNREQFLILVLIICTGGILSSAQQPIAPQQPVSNAASQGPSYDDTVKWIKDNLSLAGTLPSSTDSGNGETIKGNGIVYTLAFDGCGSLTLTETSSGSITDVDDPTDRSLNDINVTNTRYRIPFASIFSVTTLDSSSELSGADVQTGKTYKVTAGIAIAVNNGVASVGYDGTHTASGEDPSSSVPPVPLTTKNVYPSTSVTTGATPAPIIIVQYAKPGSEDAPEHMTSALRHLVDICKNHPEQAPKSLF